MAERKNFYSGNSAEALDQYSAYNALPEYQPHGLPEERSLPEKQQRTKAKTAVAPFTVFGILAATCMLVLVIFGYVQLFEATDHVDTLQNRLKAEQQTTAVLKSKYEGRIDLEQIEARAAELGLARPTVDQTIYISLTGGDRAEIYQQEKTSAFAEVFEALRQSVMELIAYLRPDAA